MPKECPQALVVSCGQEPSAGWNWATAGASAVKKSPGLSVLGPSRVRSAVVPKPLNGGLARGTGQATPLLASLPRSLAVPHQLSTAVSLSNRLSVTFPHDASLPKVWNGVPFAKGGRETSLANERGTGIRDQTQRLQLVPVQWGVNESPWEKDSEQPSGLPDTKASEVS